MAYLEMINTVFKSANNLLDFMFLWGGLLLILSYPVYFFVTSTIKYNRKKQKGPKENKSLELLSQTFILFLVVAIIGSIWVLPELIIWWQKLPSPPTAWTTLSRWIELSLAFFLLAYNFGHEYGERRWFNSCIGHIAVIFLGLIINRWMGILFISLPILLTYYAILYSLAILIVPTSIPEDRSEQWKRFHILTSYTWGIQSPIIVVDGHAWKSPETRIPGDFTWDFSEFPLPIIENLNGRPGLVWTRSHQVVAITGGTQFKRLDGPGVVFTGKLERPFQVFDLRLQLRTNEIDVVSKDGISFKARVFTAFRLDPEAWDKETYDKLRPLNAILRGADKPSYTLGSFPFSHMRIQATLGVTSTKAATGDALIYWDQWALNVVEHTARKVLSQKNLDELWRPAKDEKFANAMDAIANEIKDGAFITLRNAGILVFVARVVNFTFPGEQGQVDDISEQQIATWGSEWERKSSSILAEAQAEAEYAQQEARAYAESVMLNAIAEGLQKTQEIDPNLPRYVISMRFLSALQDFIHKQPTDRTMEEIQNQIMGLSEQHSRNRGKEKTS